MGEGVGELIVGGSYHEIMQPTEFIQNSSLDCNRNLQYIQLQIAIDKSEHNPKGTRNDKRGNNPTPMTPTTSPHVEQIHALLAERGYEVSEPAADRLRIREVDSGVTIQAVIEGDIVFFSLPCITVTKAKITPQIMQTMLAANNGISTSYFQLYDAGGGNVVVTLNNFCKIQSMGPDDQDDVLSCVHFLLADVMSARGLLGNLTA
jgi:hypothetical protein